MSHRSRLGVRSVLLVVSLLAVVPHAGCSLVFTQRPDGSRSRALTPTCSVTEGLVAADVMIGGTMAILTGALAVESQRTALERDADEELGSALLAATMMSMATASALLGRKWARGCQQARLAHEAWVEEQRSLLLHGGAP